jgi:hypothetical protein
VFTPANCGNPRRNYESVAKRVGQGRPGELIGLLSISPHLVRLTYEIRLGRLRAFS